MGFSLTVIIRIRPAPRELRKVAALAQETAEVVECHRVTGDDCYVMKAHVRDVEHLEEVIDRFAIFGQTTTSILQSSPVPAAACRSTGHELTHHAKSTQARNLETWSGSASLGAVADAGDRLRDLGRKWRAA